MNLILYSGGKQRVQLILICQYKSKECGHCLHLDISSYYCFVRTMTSLPVLFFTLPSHYFPTLVISFSRLQLLCSNGELTVACQVPTSRHKGYIIV